MTGERCLDDRLYWWPKVVQNGDDYGFVARFLTPLRFQMIRLWGYEPLALLWKLAALLIVLDGAALLLGNWKGIFPAMSFSHLKVGGVLTGLYILWWWELARDYRIGRFLFGKRLWIEVKDGRLRFGSKRKRYGWNLNQNLSFAIRPFELAAKEAWKHSMELILIVDGTKRVRVAEIFGRFKAEALVSNANMMLALGGEFAGNDVDTDPTRDAEDDFFI